MHTVNYTLRRDSPTYYMAKALPDEPPRQFPYGAAHGVDLVLRDNPESVLHALIEVLSYHNIEHFNFHRGMQGWLCSLRGMTILRMQGEFERLLFRKKTVPADAKPHFHKPNDKIDSAIQMMAADLSALEARIDPSLDFLFKNHPSLLRDKQRMFVSTPQSKDPSYFAELYGTGRQPFKIKEQTMSKDIKPGQFTQTTYTYDSETGERVAHPGEYRSRILNGSELEVGKAYRLEIVGGKNAPALAVAGKNFVALGDSEGNFSGDVLDTITYSVFATDESDLWLQA